MIETQAESRIPASHRDPAGFVFVRERRVLRQVNRAFAEDFEGFIENGGLYEALVREGLLIDHATVDDPPLEPKHAYAVLAPRALPLISRPSAWHFTQLRDAALLTLEIQQRAVAAGFTLKDAHATNVQFDRGRPLFIDSLSFQRRAKDSPWMAYRQFVEQFLAPLALMSFVDHRVGRGVRDRDGSVPMDLAVRLLPLRAFANPGLWLHLRLHAAACRRVSGRSSSTRGLSTRSMTALIESLRATVTKLKRPRSTSPWCCYYDDPRTRHALEAKTRATIKLLSNLDPTIIYDVGCNTGAITRAVARSFRRAHVVGMDDDPEVVMAATAALEGQEANVLFLVSDVMDPVPLTAPIPRHPEDPQRADVVLALALVHHLVLSRQLPLSAVAALLARLGNVVIVEFVPPSDSRVHDLIGHREPHQVHPHDEATFRESFARWFKLEEEVTLHESGRRLFRMRRRDACE